MTSGIYSQERSITETERDSIFSKITRGNQAIERNIELNSRLKLKDSVIIVQSNIIGVQRSNIEGQKLVILNQQTIISNQQKIIRNEKKIGRRKGFFSFLKGVGIGALGVLFLL